MRLLTGFAATTCLALTLAGCSEHHGGYYSSRRAAMEPPAARTLSMPAPQAIDGESTQTPAAAETEPVQAAPAVKAATEPSLIAEKPVPAPEQENALPDAAMQSVQIVTTRDTPAPVVPTGEGTADWAVPLEKMPDYLDSIGGTELAAAADAGKTEGAGKTADVGSTLGAEQEKDMTGPVLVPGTVVIDFPDDSSVTPDEFGVPAGETVATTPTVEETAVAAPEQADSAAETGADDTVKDTAEATAKTLPVAVELPEAIGPDASVAAAEIVLPEPEAQPIAAPEPPVQPSPALTLASTPDFGRSTAPASLDAAPDKTDAATPMAVGLTLEEAPDAADAFEDEFSVDNIDLGFFTELQ